MNSEDIFFSIIIPVFNREDTIKRAIESCLKQPFEKFEVIVINDCSTDRSLNVIDSFKDDRIKVFSNKTNSERCISRNNGIKYSKGKYICFLDSDDYFLENHLDVLYKSIQNISFEDFLIFTNSYLETETGEISKKTVPKLTNQNVFEYFLEFTPNPARVCISRNILLEMNFDIQLPGIEDLDLWIRIASKFPIYHIEEYTNVYYTHSNSYSLGDEKRFTKELVYFKIIKDKPELKDKIPKHSINRLLSMCHFHLAKNTYDNLSKSRLYYHTFKSFFLYPKGYNGKTNKILFVNSLYSIPLIGFMLKKSVFGIKKLIN